MARERGHTRVAVIALGRVSADTAGRTYLSEILGPLAAQPGFEVDVHLGDPGYDAPAPCRAVRHRIPRRAGAIGRIAAETRVARSLSGRGYDVLLAPLNYVPHSWHGPAVVVQHNVLSLPSAVGASRDISRLRAWYRPRALRSSLDRAREVVAVSAHLRDRLLDEFPALDPGRVRVVPYGLSSDWAKRTARRDAPGERVLVVSSLWDYKRVDLAIEAFATVARSLPGALLEIAGPGTDESRHALERLVADRGVGGRVTFLGNVPHDEMPALYGSASALLHLSAIESFGLPVLEAMGAGVPVLATRIDAVAEVGGDAPVWLDPAADAGETAAALLRILTDEEVRADAVRRGRARAEGFSWERSAALLADALREAASAEHALPVSQPGPLDSAGERA